MLSSRPVRYLRRHRLASTVIAVAAAALALSACKPAPPLGTVPQKIAQAPQWPSLADPAVLPANGHYYVYGSNTFDRLPIHVVDSLTQTVTGGAWFAGTKEGMPSRPAWAANDALWAPTVAQVPGGYVLFFAAHRISPPDPANDTCIGRATSTQPDGPFVAEPLPFSCGLGGTGGALDPNLFHGPDGKWYLYAAFGNTESPIFVFNLDASANAPRDAFGTAGFWPFAVLGKHYPWEGRFIENPSMTYDAATDTYLLAYSAGDWWTAGYSTGLARCSSPIGMCVAAATGPWLVSGNSRTGPGGLSFFTAFDGTTKAVYASFNAGFEGTTQPRAGTVAGVTGGWSPTLGAP
jgi:beta-xylosidase